MSSRHSPRSPQRRTLVAAALTAAIVLAGCSSTGKAKDAGSKDAGTTKARELSLTTPVAKGGVGEVNWILGSEPLSLDWVYSYDYPPNTVLANVCESLLRIDASFTPGPGLAEHTDHPDPLTYVYTLRSGVKFHDGSTMTSDDVAYSLNRHLDADVGSYWSGFYRNVTSVKATGPLEVTVKLKAPDVLFNQMMSVAGGVVAKKAFVEAKGKDYGTPDGGIMCTGPYKLGSWTKGESITLQRFGQYWDAGARAKAATVRFDFISDAAAQANALISGSVDGTYGVAEAAEAKVTQSGAGNVYYGPQTSTRNLIVADLKGPLGDVRIRRALSMAIDRTGFIKAAISGPSKPARAVASELTWGTGAARKVYEQAYAALPEPRQDIGAAKKLVQEAGAPDRPIVVVSSPSPVVRLLANEVQAAARRIGLEVKIKPVAAAAYSALFGDAAARKGIDLFYTTWYADVADPLQIYVNWRSDNFANYGGFKDKDYDALVDRAVVEQDPLKRAAMVTQLQKKVTDEVLWIPIDHAANNVFLSKKITGAPATNAYLYYPWAAQLGARS